MQHLHLNLDPERPYPSKNLINKREQNLKNDNFLNSFWSITLNEISYKTDAIAQNGTAITINTSYSSLYFSFNNPIANSTRKNVAQGNT